MTRLLLLLLAFSIPTVCPAANIIVKNITELNEANKKAQPGDVIILQNGEWNNVEIRLDCKGTSEKPILVRAQTPGKVVITGKSKLKLGGDFIVVSGLNFINGYAGDDAVISFRINKDKLANNCRVTECAIDDYNNPKRMDQNTWILFYGKHNRIDHSSFKNKKNMGVLLAVILDDDRSRENYHSIDHNYFGKRIPLASNTGETIRVGVSQHCQFNSFTQITDNFFEECDGEAEVISIKSGSNLVKGNLILESQGSIVLRHGDYNTVENNVILGNYKEGTGGIRVVNKGQWVVNNFLYAVRGIDFRSPLTVMNGIPNSPAHRYVQVTDAVIANNSFYNCSPVSFCDGSDAERSLPPANVSFLNNLFYNDRDSNIFRVYDDLGGFSFKGNQVNNVKQQLVPGFILAPLSQVKNSIAPLPQSVSKIGVIIPDSLQSIAEARIKRKLPAAIGFSDLELLKRVYANAKASGASWYSNTSKTKKETAITVNCINADEVYNQLAKKDPVIINLTGTSYTMHKPFEITKSVTFRGGKKEITLATDAIESVFLVKGNGNLVLRDLQVNGTKVMAHNFISSDSTGSANHFNLSILSCNVKGLKSDNGCKNFFQAYKSSVADSIIVTGNTFESNDIDYFEMNKERDDKGYYNAEKIVISHNKISGTSGVLLDIYRGGNDESTLGPNLTVSHNKFSDCKGDEDAFIILTGVQRSNIFENKFKSVYNDGTLIKYQDKVRAYHILKDNKFAEAGKILPNEYVTQENNK